MAAVMVLRSSSSPRSDPPAPTAGPSSFRRLSSRDGYPSYRTYSEQGGSRLDTDRDRFEDADGDDGRRFRYVLKEEMLRFEPPLPGSTPYPHYRHRKSPLPADVPQYSPPGRSNLPSDPSAVLQPVGTPPGERLATSTSISSTSSAQRSHRAPVPAALDLSPRTNRVKLDVTATEIRHDKRASYDQLGNGMAAENGDGRRAVTDSYLEQVSVLVSPILGD